MARNVDTPENNDNKMEELLDTIERMKLEIATLKLELANAQPVYIPHPPLVKDPNICVDGGFHDYPNPWHSITPAHCKKCGKQAESYPITYSDNGTGNPPWDFNKHGGNVMDNQNPIIDLDNSNSKYISDTSGIF